MQGVQRALSILEAVADTQPAGVGELARMLTLPKSTVQRHLWALSDAGWIRPVGEEYTRWVLTSRALLVGQRGSREGRLREVALEPMRALRDVTSETITLQVPASELDMVQIERVDSQMAVRTYAALGQVTPMPVTSGGLAYLAALDDHAVERALERPLPQLTARTVTDARAIRERIATVRQRGYAVNIGQNRLGVCAVGAAIRDLDRQPIAGLGISIPESRFDEERLPWWGEQLLATVKVIESHL